MKIPKKTHERIKSGIRRFRRVLESARSADRSEQDTVTIVTDMLADVFGYDKYEEITGEYAIRGTFCDLAVKIDGKVRYLIEVKAADKSLKENHLRQATDYAAKEGIEWVVLTNGVEWQAYRMIFEQPVNYDHVFTIDFLQDSRELADLVYMLSREGIVKQAISEYHEQREALDRFLLASIALSDPVLSVIRRELRRVSPTVRVSVDDIREALTSEVLKRDVVENDQLQAAARRVKRSQAKGRTTKRHAATQDETRTPAAESVPGPPASPL